LLGRLRVAINSLATAAAYHFAAVRGQNFVAAGYAFLGKLSERRRSARHSLILNRPVHWIAACAAAAILVGGITAQNGTRKVEAKTISVTATVATAEAGAPARFAIASVHPSLEAMASHDRFDGSAPVAAASGVGDAWYEHFARPGTAVAMAAGFNSRFDQVVAQAETSPARMAAALKRSKKAAAIGAKPTLAADAGKVTARGSLVAPATDVTQVLALAYVNPSPEAEDGALAAVSAMAASHGETIDVAPPAEVADESGLPSIVPLPSARPQVDHVTRELTRAKEEKPAEEVQVAFARPDDLGKNEAIIGRNGHHPKARNGVAVYDISAATVYMPDGTRLEAHSGIGKMADDPRYVDVKMNGPTPPHTYNLRMREQKFHGVEAIRMLPVDGKNKYGRDGFLTHSYLLRFRRAQSHGCVAFKDYDKFLNAFKRGEVRQMIVVPGAGKGRRPLLVRTGEDGRDA
jgi:hypothetical protein